jgi:hypothetical protein
MTPQQREDASHLLAVLIREAISGESSIPPKAIQDEVAEALAMGMGSLGKSTRVAETSQSRRSSAFRPRGKNIAGEISPSSVSNRPFHWLL